MADSPLLLFVGGDPALGRRLASFPRRFYGLGRLIFPVGLLPGPKVGEATDPGDAAAPVPPDQLMCLERVVDALAGTTRAVRIVDVNGPGEDRSLVERYVSAADVLPILVRPDGTRIEGAEAFTRRRLLDFLGPAAP